MADYTGFILGADNIVGLQQLSQSLMLSPPNNNITFGNIRNPAIPQPIYRGVVGGNYIFNVGKPPTGATDVVIVGYNEI
jgi:hypothetical protein